MRFIFTQVGQLSLESSGRGLPQVGVQHVPSLANPLIILFGDYLSGKRKTKERQKESQFYVKLKDLAFGVFHS